VGWGGGSVDWRGSAQDVAGRIEWDATLLVTTNSLHPLPDWMLTGCDPWYARLGRIAANMNARPYVAPFAWGVDGTGLKRFTVQGGADFSHGAWWPLCFDVAPGEGRWRWLRSVRLVRLLRREGGPLFRRQGYVPL